jgi:integrase
MEKVDLSLRGGVALLRQAKSYTTTMTMTDLLAAYLGSRECSSRYCESLRRTVKKALESGITSVDQLQSDEVNQFLASLSSLSSTTRCNIRRELLTLWRYAFEERWTEEPPLRVRKIRARTAPPVAWSLTELGRLIDCAESDESYVSVSKCIRVCDCMPAWITASYDTGLRFGDMYSLRVSEIRNGHIVKIASKTGKPVTRPLSAYALARLLDLSKRSRDGTVFQWFMSRRAAFTRMAQFYKRHGFSGSGKYLRRSCATYVEMGQPGSAWKYLQHSTPTLVPRHYEDESLRAVPCGPPPIR